MKEWHNKRLLIAFTCLALGACKFPHGAPKAPTGQVAATVDGKEITVRDLNTELAGRLPTDPKQQKLAQQQALQAIVNRKLLAMAAAKQGLQKTPEFALQQQRLNDTLLAETLQQKLAEAVPAPTPEEVSAYIAANPDTFAQRKIFAIDQIQIPGQITQDKVNMFRPVKTMEEAQAVATTNHLAFRRGDVTLDAVGVDPRVVASILKLPANEVFVIPENAALLINVVRGVTVQPLTGAPATKYATEFLKRQRTQEAVIRQMQGVIAAGAKVVAYNAAYQPPAKPPAGAAAKPAAGAAKAGG